MKKLLTPVRVTEIGDVANRLARLYKETSMLQEDTFLKTTFADLEAKGTAITEAIKKDQAVSQLEDADTQRDEAIRVLDKLLKGYESIPVATLKVHGEKLYTIFKKYGVKITTENYSSQSNLVDSLLMDFSADEVQASITALSGVSEAIAGIRTTQENFGQVRRAYETAFAKQQSKATASSLRKPLLELINKKLIPYLVAMHLSDTEKYQKFVHEVEKIINDMNEVVKARSKKK